MKAVIQRVSSARVRVDDQTVGQIGAGLLILVAAHADDADSDAQKMADRIHGMRIFNDPDGKINVAIKDLPGHAILAVSNFTVYGDPTQRRPSFVASAPYARGEALFQLLIEALRARGLHVETGVFGAHMEVELVNDGPVTLVAEVGPSGIA